ncbi:MAG: hypothetical protein ABIM99_05180 [Candidatus Dojkabacteria bacterium]
MQNQQPDSTDDLVSETPQTHLEATKEIEPIILHEITTRIMQTLKLYYEPLEDKRGLSKTSMERGSFVADKHNITDSNISTILSGLWIPSVFTHKEMFTKMTAKKGIEPCYKIKALKETVVFTRSELGRLIVDQLMEAFPGLKVNIKEG